MESNRTRNLLMTLILVPPLAGAVAVGCDDDKSSNGGMGGTGGAAMGGTDGGNMGGTGGGGTGGGMGGGGMGGGGTGGVVTCPPETPVMADVSADTTWSCPRYLLKGKIYVVRNAKLTIAAGTQVLGDANITDLKNKAALIVARGSQLIAKGTKDKPIIFTSSAPAGQRRGGDWAGLALLGNAKINTGMPCAGGAAGCREIGIEGIAADELRAKYGGIDDASSCGTLEYVRSEFAGAELDPGRELNGITFGGCGSGTKVSYVQVHRGTDDGMEFFGGSVSMDHVVLSGNEDDSLDWDFGWTGKVQFLVVHQRRAIGDYGFEGAGSPQGETLEPRSAPTIYNATLLGRPDGGKAMHLKEGTRGIMRNLIVQGWNDDVVRFTAKQVDLKMEWPMFLTIENSLFWMNPKWSVETPGTPSDDDMGFDDKGSVEAAARSNKTDVDPMLTVTDLFDGATPNYVPRNAAVGIGGATPPAGFDATATYIGAFKPGDAPWTAGWTAYPTN